MKWKRGGIANSTLHTDQWLCLWAPIHPPAEQPFEWSLMVAVRAWFIASTRFMCGHWTFHVAFVGGAFVIFSSSVLSHCCQLVSGLWLLLSRELLHCTNDFPLARLVILWILFFLRTPGSGLEEKISCWSISLSPSWWAFCRYLLRVCFRKKTISRMNDGEINVLMAGKLCWGEEIWFILMWQSGEGARNYYYILIKYLFAPCVTFMARLRRQ